MRYGLGYSIVTEVSLWLNRNIFYFRRAEIKEILKLLDKSKTVLDFGCNTGYLVGKIKKDFAKINVYGADINKYALNIAKERYTDVNFEYIGNKFYTWRKYDCIIISHVLEHIKNPDKLLKNIKKILNKEGTLIISVPQERIRGDMSVPQILYDLFRFRFENPHVRKVNIDFCKELLEKNKFKICSYRYINLFFPYVSKNKKGYTCGLIVSAKN